MTGATGPTGPGSTGSTGSLQGKVILQGATDSSGISVVATQGSTTAGSAVTASDGSYSISSLAPGDYTVTASSTGYQTESFSVIVESGIGGLVVDPYQHGTYSLPDTTLALIKGSRVIPADDTYLEYVSANIDQGVILAEASVANGMPESASFFGAGLDSVLDIPVPPSIGQLSQPVFTPDGNSFVTLDVNSNLWVFTSPDTWSATQLNPSGTYVQMFAISPDGSTVAYVDGNLSVWVSPISTSSAAATAVGGDADASAGNLAFSPDSSEVVYAQYGPCTPDNLVAVTIAGGTSTTLVSEAVMPQTGFLMSPAGGGQVVYIQGNADFEPPYALESVPLSGEPGTVLNPDAYGGCRSNGAYICARLSSDGTTVASLSSTGALETVSIGGGTPATIATGSGTIIDFTVTDSQVAYSLCNGVTCSGTGSGTYVASFTGSSTLETPALSQELSTGTRTLGYLEFDAAGDTLAILDSTGALDVVPLDGSAPAATLVSSVSGGPAAITSYGVVGSQTFLGIPPVWSSSGEILANENSVAPPYEFQDGLYLITP